MNGEGGRYYGVGTDRVYREYLKDREPQRQVVVAVIDSGIDVEHEDLHPVLWTNEDEIAGNGIDDDNNGYVDDRLGWNFIGGPGGKHIEFDTFEVTREYARWTDYFMEKNVDALSAEDEATYAYYREIQKAFEEQKAELVEELATWREVAAIVDATHSIMSNVLGTEVYSVEDVRNVESDREEVQQSRAFILYLNDLDLDREKVKEEVVRLEGNLEKGLNPDFDPRPLVGDNYDDSTERIYGNEDVEGPDPRHGTHVAGIIAARRNNGVGMDGVANGVAIMPVRALPPNGDERDKDIANAIRYAVDNGAHVINMSFGKSFSPQEEVVEDALLYAEANDVLLVHAAGNDAENNDEKASFPNPVIRETGRLTNWIEVGASNWEQLEGLAAPFSNYGHETVDVFAPGVSIYSTVPNDEYDRSDGTSMAAPVVSGVAALLMAYFSDLSASEVRDILLDSAISYRTQLVLKPGAENGEQVEFGTLSRTGGVINAFEAFRLAERRTANNR